MAAMTTRQIEILGATAGAFSVVTEREAGGDRSVTVDAHEKEPLSRHYRLDRFTRKGGAVPDGKSARHEFYVHPRNSMNTPSSHELAINYAKSEGSELRLYMSAAANFEGQTGDIFYIYAVPKSGVHVGFMEQAVWDKFWATSAAAVSAGASSDVDDEEFQRSIEAVAAGKPVETSGLRYPRDPKVALEALENAGYQCEINSSHTTFISASTGKQYVEAHHLIPMSAQPAFDKTLDVAENIIALCPTCHRHLHLGDPDSRLKHIRSLLQTRREGLEKKGIRSDIATVLSACGFQRS